MAELNPQLNPEILPVTRFMEELATKLGGHITWFPYCHDRAWLGHLRLRLVRDDGYVKDVVVAEIRGGLGYRRGTTDIHLWPANSEYNSEAYLKLDIGNPDLYDQLEQFVPILIEKVNARKTGGKRKRRCRKWIRRSLPSDSESL